MVSFGEIILSKSELKLLKVLRKQDIKIDNHKVKSVLLSYRLIGQTPVSVDSDGNVLTDETFYITDIGERYLMYLKRNHRIKFFEWMRYVITTIIAIAALLISLSKI